VTASESSPSRDRRRGEKAVVDDQAGRGGAGPGGRSLVQQALDVLVFAPVGLAVSAAEELPELIDKGRSRVAPEISNARIVGRLAVTQGQRRARRLVEEATDRLARGPATAPPPGTRVTGAESAPRAGAPGGGRPEPPRGRERPDPAGLAIPGYDSLSASQVVQRLDGLSPSELEAVRAYEAATRGRKTILNKAAQLRASPHA
jgi:hypothetical protein